MPQLTPAGQSLIADIAERHGFGMAAVSTMLDALIRGNGRMAQFSHAELGGSGQWMQGGMTMISDMFDNRLKARVDGLCAELAGLLAREPGLLEPVARAPSAGTALPDQTERSWWPTGLGAPSSTGSQNDVRYAYFDQARRLAIDLGGRVALYDTLDHRIGGVSQQQSSGSSLRFDSQHGVVDLASLPLADGAAAPGPQIGTPASAGPTEDVLATIERLADLRGKGVLSEAEFQAKKTELLGRL